MKPKPSNAKQVERLLFSLGFGFLRVGKGSHRMYRHADGRTAMLAFHGRGKPIRTGTLKKVISSIGITVEEFNDLV